MATHMQVITDNLDLWTSALLTKSTAGRGNNGRVEAYGIKKLRELILELAVRGKLVPQDLNDEPASVLLERIATEKRRLIKEGIIKKEIPLPEIAEDEKPYCLPQGWEFVRLGNITNKIGSGSTPRGGSAAYVDSGIPFLRSQNVWNYGLEMDDVAYISAETHEKMSNTMVETNDILLNITGASLGRCAIYPDGAGEANVSQHVTIIRPTEVAIRSYLHYCILSPYTQILIWGRQVGMAREGLSKKVLEQFEMPLPPLAEQHRIVAKVDELMALCDQLEQQQANSIEAHQTLVETLLGTLTNVESQEEFAEAWTRIADHFDTLFTTEQSIDQLKQTILQLAVIGKLVPQDPNDEPASVLLERIEAEKKKLIAADKLKNEKQQPPIADEEKCFDLSSGWEWVRFSDYAVDIATGPFGSMIHQSDYVKNGVPLINPSHMINDQIVPDMDISISEEMAKDFASYSMTDGDIVMARRGEVGRIALVTKNEVGWLCGTGSFVLRFSKDVARHYLKLVFRCDFVRRYLAGEAVGTTMFNLNHGILRKMPLAVPPLAEQHRIVAKVDELMALCDALKVRLAAAQTTQVYLADAIVEQAVA